MPIELTTKTQTTTTRRHRIELNGTDLMQLLADVAAANLVDVQLPEHGVHIYFAVPGGADWSNTAIDIDEDNPVIIEWEEEEVSQS